MSRYDASRASDLALLATALAALGQSPRSSHYLELPLSTTTRHSLEAFASVLLDEPSEEFQELAALRAECRVKTRAEYDREIGNELRSANSNPLVVDTLVGLSRSAPEDGS